MDLIKDTNRAIFFTNTFASTNPALHTKLWIQFEKEVPYAKRSGYYGADNVAYIKWLRENHSETVDSFFRENLEIRGN